MKMGSIIYLHSHKYFAWTQLSIGSSAIHVSAVLGLEYWIALFTISARSEAIAAVSQYSKGTLKWKKQKSWLKIPANQCVFLSSGSVHPKTE